jgi:hypothetical protein
VWLNMRSKLPLRRTLDVPQDGKRVLSSTDI